MLIYYAKRFMAEKGAVAILGVFVSIAIGLGLFAQINRNLGLKDDNVIESNIEDMIESKLGLSIDLTPDSPDEDDYTLEMWRKD